MTGQIVARLQLAGAGALGGFLLWAVFEYADQDWNGGYAALVMAALVLTFFGGVLAMAGPIGFGRALPRALGLAGLAGGLVWLTQLRYAAPDEFLHNPMQALAALCVAVLPVPFLIAGAKSGWRDYSTLFQDSWALMLRFAAAAAFTGLVWLVIYLSNEVLSLVGIEVIGDLLQHDVVPVVLTGAVLGLAMAVIFDLADLLSPYVVLRLFRLLLPVVLGVMLVFLIALPFRGLDGLVSGMSPALLLLAMVAGGIALVSIAIDQDDGAATLGPVLIRATQGMALVLPVVAGLALWAVWLRVEDYGWTPERVFIALIAGVGVGYGLVYAGAVLRGAGWMERIRRGNVLMALGVIVLAALWLTPVLNAERIAAGNQLARYEAGKVPVEELDLYAIGRWGKPGAVAMARLEELAQEPGQEALAKALASGAAVTGAPDPVALAARLAAVMPVQPPTATATRDVILGAAAAYQLQDWLRVCETVLAEGSPACLMVVAELMPLVPGEEAVLFLERSADYTEISGLYLDAAGGLQIRQVSRPDGVAIPPGAAAGLLRQYQLTQPPVTAAMLNQLGTGEAGLVISP